jgi:transcription antitermination protein NusB
MNRQRSQAREVALQLLFMHDLNPAVGREDVLRYVRGQLGEGEPEAFALGLYDGARGRLADIDGRIGRAAENWRLARMAVIDRNILRLGAYELSEAQAPAGVVLNEAIELARRFGSADSPAFVNGVLDRLYRDAASVDKETRRQGDKETEEVE